MVYLVTVVVESDMPIYEERSHGPFQYALAMGLEMFDWFRVRIEKGQQLEVYVCFEWDVECMAPLALLSTVAGSMTWRLDGQRN